MSFRQSFSALKNYGNARARAQPENLRSRSNVLSAAQFCAHFKVLESFKFTLKEQFFASKQAMFL